jgi:hypothetical protein
MGVYMKYIMLAAVTALAVGTAVTAHAENERPRYIAGQPAELAGTPEVDRPTYAAAGSNVASLTALLANWDQAGFDTPSKPSQYRVYGRKGYVTSGPGYNATASLIRSAVNAFKEGRIRDAETDIAQASSLLAASNPRRA